VSPQSGSWDISRRLRRPLKSRESAKRPPEIIRPSMHPSRKRTIRLVIALGVAVLLGGALAYTSFNAATEARQPSELISNASPGKSYELTGKVVKGSVRRSSEVLRFRIRDRRGSASVPVRYTGAVPDPFREGREVIVTGSLRRGVFHAEKDSLVTKCPSKFSKKDSA
jgi:cytochrome c-type biogenesis protein CcmE